MLRKMLCPAIACVLILLCTGALADDDQCLPWYGVTWSEEESADMISATIYVGVYECSGSLDLTGWPYRVTGTLVPIDDSWANALWQKVINDCWSFYGVYPEKSVGDEGEICVFRLPTGSVTVERDLDDTLITIMVAHEE